MKNYTSIVFPDGKHMTWHYGTPLKYPHGVSPGDKTKVDVVGFYKDDEVECWVVEWDGHKTQPNKDTLLHITTKHKGKPVLSGKRATENGYTKMPKTHLEGVWE